jgi:methyltransferase
VLFVPGEALVKRGPFRLIPHPNYAVVALEMPVLPLALGLWGTAFVFGLLNLAMLTWRIRVEEGALRPLRS